MNIKAGMLAAQNVGSVISFNAGTSRITTTLEGYEKDPEETTVMVYTPVQDDPFFLGKADDVEISLPKGAHDASILLKEFMRFANDVRDDLDQMIETPELSVTNNYMEVSG